MNPEYAEKVKQLFAEQDAFITRPNAVDTRWSNGLYNRYVHPVLTREHAPVFWRYDLNETTNPMLIERLGINATFNAGAMEWQGKIVMVARVEGFDRKSFFAIAESETGVDGFRFWDYPIAMPETDDPDVNVYDMRLVRHEDGWIYGLFCTERKDPDAAPGDMASAVAQCGIARTRDLVEWERLDDLKSQSPQQRNVVLHPEFIDGRYAFYTRPQDSFISAGSGGGIGWALSNGIEHAEVGEELIIDPKLYHTIKEAKNGMGGPPIKTEAGWLHVAHGVRECAAGMRYVLYAFLCDREHPERVIARPGGYLLAPMFEERVGDVSNVAFTNGMVARENGDMFIYYASSDTRMHVATTTVDRMLDYVTKTPEDPLRSAGCVQQRCKLIDGNMEVMRELGLR